MASTLLVHQFNRLAARRIGAASVGALAVGALATGALAIGVVALGRLAIGRIVVGSARFREVEIDRLTVRQLRVLEPDAAQDGIGLFNTPVESAARRATAAPH